MLRLVLLCLRGLYVINGWVRVDPADFKEYFGGREKKIHTVSQDVSCVRFVSVVLLCSYDISLANE